MKETQHTEFKSVWKDEHLKGICGFANTKGGTLFIGKDDHGKVIGIGNPKRLLEDLPNKLQTNLGILGEVHLFETEGKTFLEIIIEPSSAPISYHGKFYIRSGSTNQELRGSQLQQFLLKKMGRTWDDIVEEDAKLEDIDEKAVQTFIKKARETERIEIEDDIDIPDLFEKLGLLKEGQLKRAALLLFGKRPTKFYPNAFLKVGKFGASPADLMFQEVVDGNVFEMADKAVEVCHRKFFRNPIRYEGIQRIEDPEFPLKSLREALLNAIAHKDYSGTAPIQVSIDDDQVEIWNEGGLSEELTFEELYRKHPSKPRNPLVANAFFLAGFIESWGRGTIKMIDECKALGFASPEFGILAGGFDTKLKKEIWTEEQLKEVGLSEKLIKALLYTKKHGSISNSEYQELNNVSKMTAFRDLNELVKKEFLEKTGKTGVGTSYAIKVSKVTKR